MAFLKFIDALFLPTRASEGLKTDINEHPGRLFLLFFWVNESSVKVGEVLDYFFKSLYRKGDRVILADQEQLHRNQ